MSLIVAILAGGRGERMGGVVKPLLRTREGITVLETIERELAPIADEVLIVAPAELADPLGAVSRAQVVIDRGLGPAAALLEAARASMGEWMLAVGGDQPRPSRKLAQRLLAEAGDRAEAVAVVEEGLRQPLFALYRRAALVSLAGSPPSLSLQAVLRSLATAELPAEALDEDERACFLDADTPEDAARLGLASG